MSDDDRRIYDMVARRFLAVFHPDAVFENTRLETTVAGRTSSAPAARVLLVPGWRGVYGEGRRRDERAREADDDEGADQQLPKLEQRRDASTTREVAARGEGDQAAAALLATRRCWARWRPPASSSTTTSCARR